MKKRKILSICLAAVTCLAMLSGCGKTSAEEQSVKEQTSVSDTAEDMSVDDETKLDGDNSAGIEDVLNSSKIGTMTGSQAVKEIQGKFPDAKIIEYDDLGSAVEALKADKLDYIVTSRSTAMNFARNNSDKLCVIDKNFFDTESTASSAAVRKGDERLAEINSIITRFLEDGTMDKIISNWVSDTAAYDTADIPRLGSDAPIWKVGVAANREPTSFIRGENEICGLDPELAERIAYEMGMRAEFVDMQFSALIPALESGKVDFVIANMGATDERKQIVDFTVEYFDNPNVILAQKTDANLKYAAEVKENAADTVSDNSDLEEKLNSASIGVMQGSSAIKTISGKYPNAAISEFDSIGDAVEALKANKLDYVVTAYSTAKNYERYNSSELYVPGFTISDDKVAIAVKKGNSELLEKLSSHVDEYLADGTMDKIIENWIGGDDKDAAYDTSTIPYDPNTPVLKIGIAANREPMCFVSGDSYLGMDCELIERIAYDIGMHVEFSDMQFKSLIPALQSDRVDAVISNITVTEERAEVVDFSTSYFDNPQAVIMRRTVNDGAAVSNASAEKQSFFEKLKASFTRTFITENRWKLVLNGLGVTLLISVSAFIIGSLWGCVVCAGLRSKKKLANIPARVYVRLLQGTPIVVLLMILYYIVFKSFDISAIIVAIIGFALNLGAYTSEIFRTAIDSVDKGQIEAASAIGFSKFKVFSKIVFPQAARNALPVYKGEFISLVKSTSIVGYIAIQDLTKASDIIRSRTYEAFFPLIATAVIYFLVTYIFILILNAIEKKIDPKRRKRTLKGVELQ